MRKPLVVVSNRGPMAFRRASDGSLETSAGAGGLVMALRPLVESHEVSWVASAMSEADRDVAAAGPWLESSPTGARFRLRLVAHDPETYRLFYTVLANPVLWFVQHGLWDLKHDPTADLGAAWGAYVAANRSLANAAVEELDERPGADLFVQDYHLYLVPSLVRAARPAVRIAHFVHIPWVAPDAWQVLPAEIVTAVHEGLLACDSVGFHTERWRAAFVECCGAFLGRSDEAERRSHANPVAVDVEGFTAVARSAAVEERRAELAAVRPETLVLRVDRTDPSKNAVRGFEAFELLLEREPALHGRIGLLALLDPSRQGIPEYVDYRRATERAAARVNERFGRRGWEPVTLDVRDDFLASVAGYLEYDVLLVNPVMDGLNLVAEEAPLVNRRDGTLVLSTQAGAFERIGRWALPVDPLDVPGQADALAAAIALPPAERRERLERLRECVRANDPAGWASRELAELHEKTTLRGREDGDTMRP